MDRIFFLFFFLFFFFELCESLIFVEKFTKTRNSILKNLSVSYLSFRNENLEEEDNLSTRDKWPVPNMSFVRRFYLLVSIAAFTIPLKFVSGGVHVHYTESAEQVTV